MAKISVRAAVVLSVSGTFFISGCATPPGKLEDREFNWVERQLPLPLSDVYSRLQAYSRQCGGFLKGAVPEWLPSVDGKSATIDLYVPTVFGGRSDWVYGVVKIQSQTDHSTKVMMGVQTVYSQPERLERQVTTVLDEIQSGKPSTCP